MHTKQMMVAALAAVTTTNLACLATGESLDGDTEAGEGSGAVTSSSGEDSSGEADPMSDSTGGPGATAPPDPPGSTDDESSGSSGEPMGPPSDCPSLRIDVTAGSFLNLRPDPSTDGAAITGLPRGLVVERLDEVTGESIDGNDVWYEVGTPVADGFISSAFATCTTDEAPSLEPLDGFWLPLECGSTYTVSQGNFGNFSHQGRTAYAFDFSLGVGNPLVAMADGVVWDVFDETMPGDNCYSGGGPECFPFANLVLLMHEDGTTSIYKHLSEVFVTVGEFLPRGEAVGLSGSSGYSTGPHAHIMRQEECGEANCTSIPLAFEDVGGSGVPTSGQSVTSDNCP